MQLPLVYTVNKSKTLPFQALSGLSKKFNLPLNVHVLETKLQRVLGQEKYGRSLVRYLHDLELLDERMQIIHAIWVDEKDMDLIAAAQCSVAHNPICNLKLGSGIMPFRQLRDRGINICLGSDEACSDDSLNMWSVAKLTGLLHNITDPDYRSWVKAPEVLWAMLRGGAKAMRLDRKVGRLAPGYEADLILLDLNTLAFTPLNDLRRQLIYCEQGSSVVLTMVAGQVVVENGKVLTIDEEAIKAEVRELMSTYQVSLKQLDSEAQKLEPYYQQMYFQAAATDVGMNRWAIDSR
ncbi:amidohydrolase family protein [Leptolyngbya ohadii]|uniref:amidohydrolase family protein n=1 Tax=Leptolyngbya ohadii TaxID=1962290 RepID=UPI0019D4E359|nr:amidohydrolase family protein [Leptolyngbya ohadii]